MNPRTPRFELVTTTPVQRIDLAEARRLGGIRDASHRSTLSETTRDAIGLSETVDDALTGLTGAQIDQAGLASSTEVAIGYIVAYLRHHQFSAAELIDVVWAAADTLEKRTQMRSEP